MKTREEIDKLKQDWLADPIWDIETTKGFEDHQAELLAFRKETELNEDARLFAEEKTKAAKMGLEVEDYRTHKKHTDTYVEYRNNAQKLLVHYLCDKDASADERTEVAAIAEFIIRAAVAQTKADLIEERGQK